MDLSEKNEFKLLIKQAKKSRIEEVLERFKKFDAMNDSLFKAAMPENTPDVLIKKRTTNRLLRMKHEKELKKLFG